MSLLTAGIDIWFVNLGLKFSDMKKSFSVFGFDIYFYGCVIAVSVLLGLAVACAVAKKTGQDPEIYMSLVIYSVIIGVICARIYYVVFAWDDYKNNLLQIFNLRGGGLAIYGGVIGGAATVVIYSKLKKLPAKTLLDTACCGLIAGQCSGRWSNFFNMECFGRYTNGPLAMALNLDKVNRGMVTAELTEKSFVTDGITYIQVHPTFLYESLWSLMTLLILLFFTKRKKFDGQIFLMYVIGYGSGRFWIEGLRTDSLMLGKTGLAVSQVLAGASVLIGLALLILGLRKAARKEKEAALAAGTDSKNEAKGEPSDGETVL
ncbi:MAG: prolipoprotein diacylglyceryl transferase [Lachnospiraceae bacterium]|nr:prolipoprotein diacylglyceryl transferase [Lachnospiraceae bacterium]